MYILCYGEKHSQKAQHCATLDIGPSVSQGELFSVACPTIMLGFLLTHFLFLFIIAMFEKEITLDDVIDFIIKNRNNIEMMDEISNASFPFTTKYLKWRERWTSAITQNPYQPYVTYCSSNKNDKPEK